MYHIKMAVIGLADHGHFYVCDSGKYGGVRSRGFLTETKAFLLVEVKKAVT
jgi:hypothetical protein